MSNVPDAVGPAKSLRRYQGGMAASESILLAISFALAAIGIVASLGIGIASIITVAAAFG